MNRVALLIAIGAIPSFGFAGELEDVQACIRAAGEYGSAELKIGASFLRGTHFCS